MIVLRKFGGFVFRVAGIMLVFVILANAGIYAFSRQYIHNSLDGIGNARTALVLGAAVRPGGELSPLFQDRVDAALLLYSSGKAENILVSGDNSRVTYNEVEPVRDYLLQKGVPGEAIFLDHAGFDTYSTMYRARDVFQADSIIISTQSFHLPRAIFLARALGIEARGFRADRRITLPKNYIRESLANVKALIDLAIRREPKYLGEPIPISSLNTP